MTACRRFVTRFWGLTRVLAFTDQFGCDGGDAAMKARLASLRQGSGVTFRLRRTSFQQGPVRPLTPWWGLISIVQNDIFKVLTIFSIAGIPPTLIAGIYGMNFKGMRGIRLVLRLSVLPRPHSVEHDPSHDLVQGQGLVLRSR